MNYDPYSYIISLRLLIIPPHQKKKKKKNRNNIPFDGIKEHLNVLVNHEHLISEECNTIATL